LCREHTTSLMPSKEVICALSEKYTRSLCLLPRENLANEMPIS